MLSRDLHLSMIRRSELLDVLTAALVAHVGALEFAPQTAETEAYNRGYYAALQTIARGAGIVDNTKVGSTWPALEGGER